MFLIYRNLEIGGDLFSIYLFIIFYNYLLESSYNYLPDPYLLPHTMK